MTKRLSECPITESSLPFDQLLLRLAKEGKNAAGIAVLSASETPPRGCAGWIDWHSQGALSKSLQAGIFEGKQGECGLFIWQHRHHCLPILLVGIGLKRAPQALEPPLEKNLGSLGSRHWVVSRSEFSAEARHGMARALPAEGALWTSA